MPGRLRARIVGAAAACSVNMRNANLRRAQVAFGVMWIGDWAVTVAIGVVAFHHGGAVAVGLVGVARMVPAALVAPFAATIADRVRRDAVLVWIGVLRAMALGGAGAAAVVGGPVALVYAGVVVATVAQTLFRPAHSALLPSLCRSPTELMSASVVRGLLDSLATLVGPLVAALLLKLSGAGAVFVAASALSALAAALIVTLRYETPPRLTSIPARSLRAAMEGLQVIASDRRLTLLTTLGTFQTLTRGALSVFSVVVAIKLLGSGGAGVGVLTAAIGVGALVGSLTAALLIGRGGLARWFGVGVVLWGAPLIGLGALPRVWSAMLVLALVGVGNALVDVGAFTLLGRLADDVVLARVFAAFEGIITLGVAAGALAAPLLIGALGIRPALAVIGALAPTAVLVCWRGLRSLDHDMHVRDADVALLQGIPMLRTLPQVTIEQLAAGLSRMQLPAGGFVFEQGDHGDDFYVIETGHADVVGDGQIIRELGPGDGFGEIALLRGCRRTTSVSARTPLAVCAVSRAAFVAAVAGYSASAGVVDALIVDQLSRFSPGEDHPYGTDQPR